MGDRDLRQTGDRDLRRAGDCNLRLAGDGDRPCEGAGDGDRNLRLAGEGDRLCKGAGDGDRRRDPTLRGVEDRLETEWGLLSIETERLEALGDADKLLDLRRG
ncbi:hypothetical protein Hanom_Chr08g00758601 [Helianthus anomalus]